MSTTSRHWTSAGLRATPPRGRFVVIYVGMVWMRGLAMSMVVSFLAGLSHVLGAGTLVGDRHHIFLDVTGTWSGGANIAGLPFGMQRESFGRVSVAITDAWVCTQSAWRVAIFLPIDCRGVYIMYLYTGKGCLLFSVYLAGIAIGVRSRLMRRADVAVLATRKGGGRTRTTVAVIGLGRMGGWSAGWASCTLSIVTFWAEGAAAAALAPIGLHYAIEVSAAFGAGGTAMKVRHGLLAPLGTVFPRGLSAKDAVVQGACIGALGVVALIRVS